MKGWGNSRFKVYLGLVFMLVAAAAPAGAEVAATGEDKRAAAQTEPEKLPPLEVVGAPATGPTGSVLTSKDLATGPAQNLPGFFEEQSGIDLTRRSLLGEKNRQVQIRGLDESRYQVYLDGRSLKGSGVFGGYFVDWSTLSLAGIERVEIIRGAQSAEYGNTLGGIIKITTATGSKEPKLALDASYGSWDTQNYRLAHTGGYGPVEYALAASFAKSSGYLRNNFIDPAHNYMGSFTYKFPWDMSITLKARYSAQETGMIVANRPSLPFFRPNEPQSDGDILFGPGVPFWGFKPGPGGGPGFDYGDSSYVNRRRFDLDLGVKQKLWRGEVEAHLFYFQTFRRDKFYALNHPDLLILERHSLDEDTWGWNIKTRQTLGKVRLGFGLEGSYYGYGALSNDFFLPAYLRFPPSSSAANKNAQKLHGGFVDALIPLTKWAELYLGLRYDNYDAAANINPAQNVYVQGIRKDYLSPKSTLTFRPTAATDIYVSVNFASRFPTLPEFYWFGAGYQPPNRAQSLSPEFGMQYEAGLTQRLPFGTTLRVRGYYYDINQYIRTVFGFRPSRVVYNIDLVKLRGVEVEAETALPYHLFAFANYTWQQTSTSPDPLGGDVRELTEFPDHKFNVGLKYRAPSGAEGKCYVRLVSKRAEPVVSVVNNRVTDVRLRPMKGFYTVNLEGRYPVANWRGFTGFLYGGVYNLTGEFYEESAGFPMPKQTLYGGVQLRY
ncbi:MAG: TonB-dependent receptor plug domain-containing protein [Desulfobaccales bacterium]